MPYQNQNKDDSTYNEILHSAWQYLPQTNWFMRGIKVKVDGTEVSPSWQIIAQPNNPDK